jgi:hypothetical protein
MGTEVDISVSNSSGLSVEPTAITQSNSGDNETIAAGRKLSFSSNSSSVVQSSIANDNTHRRKSMLPFGRSGDSQSTIVYGTAILRRNCKPEDMSLCFSLILSERTFDIQCLNTADFDFLFYNLKDFCGIN